MEAVRDDQVMGCRDSMMQIIKGKRTKQLRAATPLRVSPLGMSHSNTSSSGGRIGDGYDSGTGCEHAATSTLTTSAEVRESTEFEEDMANCLILLVQSQRNTQQCKRKNSQIPGNVATGVYAYQCKTCDKCFPSFQALGGHRTSHKKQKTTTTDQEKQSVGSASLIDQENAVCSDTTTITNLSLRMSNGAWFSSANSNKQKLHECSLCGAVFSSGQALGGHMRRHRSFVINNTCTTSTRAGTGPSKYIEFSKDRNSLKLDLNLPAPEDDHKKIKFSFQPKEKALVLCNSFGGLFIAELSCIQLFDSAFINVTNISSTVNYC